MIETVEELGKVLRYRHTDETYDEVINRYGDIISRWHTTHTTMLYKLKQHLKTYDYGVLGNDELNSWFDELKSIILGAEK